MVKKENIKVNFSGNKPENNIVKAKIPNSVTGAKIGFNHRYSALVNTGTIIGVPGNYKICFRLVPALANRGMVATNAPGSFTHGEIGIHLLNCGREIVEVKDGDPIAELWLEEIRSFDWEAVK